jgi:hypothetical protein
MPALHNRVFDIVSTYTDGHSAFDCLQGVRLDSILDMINSDNITIDYCEGSLYIEWNVDGEQLNACFEECENY